MNRRLGVLLLLTVVLLTTAFVGSAYAAPKAATTAAVKSMSVTVQVVRADGSFFDPVEDNCWVYLYKPDYVTGKQYNEVLETDANGFVTFSRVPAQEMILMVIPVDNYTTSEGYQVFQQLPQWWTVLTAEDLASAAGSASTRAVSPFLQVVYPY